MHTIALITEGVTDQIVLDRLIKLVCRSKFPDGIDTNFLQPPLDRTDESRSTFGGWELVLNHCESEIEDAFIANDFVIVHLDTDCCDHVNFGISLTENGADKSKAILFQEVQTKLDSIIGDRLISEFGDRLIVSVAIHSTESWLLLVIFSEMRPKNSFSHLQRNFSKKHAIKVTKSATSYYNVVTKLTSKNVQLAKSRDIGLEYTLTRLQGLLPSV